MNIIDLPWTPPTDGLVLDPYAGRRKWWKGLPTSNVIFVDRFAATPGVVRADICNLPFADGAFDEVWADPPHYIRKSPFAPSSKLGYFGQYPTRAAVHQEWTAAAQELWRVTKPGAHLTWKIIDGAKTANQCVCRRDAAVLDLLWPIEKEISLPSRVPWSTAMTVYQRRVRKS